MANAQCLSSAANESTNRRVMWFSVGEAVVLIGMGVAQVRRRAEEGPEGGTRVGGVPLCVCVGDAASGDASCTPRHAHVLRAFADVVPPKLLREEGEVLSRVDSCRWRTALHRAAALAVARAGSYSLRPLELARMRTSELQL